MTVSSYFDVPDLSSLGSDSSAERSPSAERGPSVGSSPAGGSETREEGQQVHYTCVDCGILSPPAETSYTLISARYGWRLHREHDERTGELLMQWRCPDCWESFRGRAVSTIRDVSRFDSEPQSARTVAGRVVAPRHTLGQQRRRLR